MNGKMLSRRDFLKLTGAAGLSVFLSSCGLLPTPTPENITLDVWWFSSGEYYDNLLTQAFQSYSTVKPNVDVKVTYNPYEQWREKLLTAAAADILPEMAATHPMATASLASKGVFLPLDSYFAKDGIKPSDFIGSKYEQSLWQGKPYAFPASADYYALIYNKDVYQEVGLDPESPPLTTNELIEHSLKLIKKDGEGNVVRLGYVPDANQLKYWGYIFGGEWYDAERNKITANHPKNVEALEWITEYVKEVGYDVISAWLQTNPYSYGPGNPFATGNTAYLFEGYWMYDVFAQYSPTIKYGVAFWPTLKGTPEERKNYIVEGWDIGITKSAKNPDAAWEFIKYMFFDNGWKTTCPTFYGNALSAQMEEWKQCTINENLKDSPMTQYFHVFTETALAGTKYWSLIPVNSFYQDQLVRALDFAIRGQKTPQEALDEVTETVQRELDQSS